MNKKGIVLLKILFAFIIIISSFLYVAIIPNNEIMESVLKITKKYNAVPYLYNDKTITLKEPNYNTLKKYTGTITAYGPDCAGCSGITSAGYKVAENINGIITSTTITYNDKEYGDVRVLAADVREFPYGTIIKVTGERINDYILGIVLDTGGAMKNAWAEGNILIDLLFQSEKLQEVYDFGRQKNVTFEVLRYGY